MHRFLWLIALVLIMSCSQGTSIDAGKEKASETGRGGASGTLAASVSTTAGPYSLEISPEEATRNTTFQLITKGFNPADAKIEWLVKRTPSVNVIPDQLKTTDIKKGDTIQAKATINGREILSNTVLIKNSLPEVSGVKFLPPVSTRDGAVLRVEASGKDADEDTVTLTYEWTKNGLTAGNESSIDVPLHRGDRFTVKVVPFDGETYGRPATIYRDIANVPPKITEIKRTGFDGKALTYKVNAFDSDEDTLTYSIKSGPQGMTIDPSTGVIKWVVPPEFKGQTVFTVSVTDGHGGEALYDLPAVITTERTVKSPQ